MGACEMSNSVKLLKRLDELLNSPVELTLYGRAALELGFKNPKPEYSRSFDVDILFIIESAKLSPSDISLELNNEQIPDVPEIREQFDLCGNWLKARALCI